MSVERCIICDQPITERSVEHIIPEAVGGRITIDTVCKTCNSQLGDKIDYRLTDSLLFQWIRKTLGIKNRDGKIPTLFEYYRDNDGAQIVVKRGDGVNMPEYYDGSKKPTFEILSIDGNHITARFSGSDEESIVKRGKREFAKYGIIISEEEIQKIIHEGSEVSWGNTHVDVPISFEPYKYLPCFIKIAYESMRTIFPNYNSDPRCEELRHFLVSSIEDNYENDFRCDDIFYDHSVGEPVFTYSARFSVRNDKLYMDIILFNKVIMLIPVSSSPAEYPLEKFTDINLFELL